MKYRVVEKSDGLYYLQWAEKPFYNHWEDSKIHPYKIESIAINTAKRVNAQTLNSRPQIIRIVYG